ncbi:carbohydrate porin [Noviherbaspirillum sp.]|uniref:carbohydrate porin n=1 Tax=Noviherbaspirillum sp. TaxID=1926288 RepID=UPI002B46B4B3|nr:carbohydrate porin [Noviherbaspirillum sp.]HJV81847.1 carbohydrate porin [Noviherbaspirillum sp.]
MFQSSANAARIIWLAALAGLPFLSYADEIREEAWSAHFQTTYIWEVKPSLSAPYTGEFSLRPEREKAYSFSATAALGFRPWAGGELYFDPELVQGVPLSNLRGLGGMANGEQQKTGGPNPTLYRARLFLRQTWGLGGEKEAVESDFNQMAGMVDKRRIVVTAGNLSVTDIFDNSAYAHDARTQFMNWALLAYGAYDFAADARGYSWGAAVEYIYDDWAVRGGRFMQPAESNGLPLDKRIFTHYGDQLEVEHGHTWGGQPGKVHVLAFRNRANMGSFRDASVDAANNGGVPDVARVRTERTKIGFGVSAEQGLTSDIGVFARASWNDGASETYAFTEIERSFSAGAVVRGGAWNRVDDTLGIAWVRNGLSQAHRDYLAAGGVGAFIGDGRLNYRPESIVEAYYSFKLAQAVTLSLDAQHIVNPAYNADRGPVNVGSIRLHAQY